MTTMARPEKIWMILAMPTAQTTHVGISGMPWKASLLLNSHQPHCGLSYQTGAPALAASGVGLAEAHRNRTYQPARGGLNGFEDRATHQSRCASGCCEPRASVAVPCP